MTEQEIIDRAKLLVATHFVDKKTNDLLMLTNDDRRFVFVMRMYYMQEVEGKGKFRCSAKQLKYLESVVSILLADDGQTKDFHSSMEKSVREIKKSASEFARNLMKKHSKKISKELGVEDKIIYKKMREYFSAIEV